MKRWESAAAILAGRWQVPLAICAIVVGGIALYRMKPPKQSVPFEALLADILALAECGAYHDAADAAANLLENDPPPPLAERARLHGALADVIYRQETVRGIANRTNARLLLEHHEAAIACGARPDGHAALRAGQAHEWLGETQPAIKAYRSVLSRGPSADERRSALQGLVRLLDGRPRAQEERRGYLQALLDEEGIAPGYLWWALQRAVQEALDQDDVAWARELLTHQGERLKRSDLRGYHDYLWAWVYLHEEQTELAEPLLDRVDQWLAQDRHIDAELDQAGFLPAMSLWLRGRLELTEGRPQAALACFDEALALQSHGDLLVVAAEGRAEALGLLGRHGTAVEAIRAVSDRLHWGASGLTVGYLRLRQTVMRLLRERREESDYENALRYLKLALELTPGTEPQMQLDLLQQLGREYTEAAAGTTDLERKRTWHAVAGETYEQASELARLDEPRYAALLWESANQYDQAGRTRDARRMLECFAAGRSLDPRMPQGLLRLGQACAADGQLTEAIEHYRQLIRSYPRLEEASRSRVLVADCLVALGEQHYAEAQSLFESLLEDEHVAPPAQVFHDALFGLCDLLYQREEYAAAISRMEDFMVFYPQDPECYGIRFMLADAYRGSARALLEDEGAGSEATRRRVSRERFQRAAELFGEFANEAGNTPGVDWDAGVYQRLALFYRGDCLVELNEPSTLAEALAIYRQAAARYQGEPAALAAQVQIANIYLRQGKLIEAARAIERARWLLGSIPEHAFVEHDGGMDQAAWDRYLGIVRSSHLFRDVFAQTP